LTRMQATATNRINIIRPDAPELALPGGYGVGVRTDSYINPDQIDVVNCRAGKTPHYDRPLTVETWYPAATNSPSGTVYDTILRDGITPTRLSGGACRDAVPAAGHFALVIVSHGYPGNRYLMAHLGENLASKGYIVAAIDHTDSTYDDQGAFGSTLVNRPLDQRYVIDRFAGAAHPLAQSVDVSNVAVIGYSMGAYGALVFGGAGVSPAAVDFDGGAPDGLLARHLAHSASHRAVIDPRVKVLVPIGAWGAQHGMWTEAGLAGLQKPTLLIGGSRDDTSDYVNGIRRVFSQTTGTTRHLLTFEAAGHNAAAPIPAPVECRAVSPALDIAVFQHYGDTVWDTVRMNNIAQHFITAFLDLHLKQDRDKGRYLGLCDYLGLSDGAPDPAWPTRPDGADWPGFPEASSLGLGFETLVPTAPNL